MFGFAGLWGTAWFSWETAGNAHVWCSTPPCFLLTPAEQPAIQIKFSHTCCFWEKETFWHLYSDLRLEKCSPLPLYKDFPGQPQSKDQSQQPAPPNTHREPRAWTLCTPSGWRDEPKHKTSHIYQATIWKFCEESQNGPRPSSKKKKSSGW